ncbi:MAG: diacylglycerol kinase family lipid kinase [Chloroflexota bacterium]|nr:diacylglycerol kinase family lipid kinase [Chloroflexota bacterium]
MVIFNPTAGARDVHRELRRVIAYLEDCGWQLTLRETRGRGDATTFACEAAAIGLRAAFVVGGDGTINEAVNGLVGSEVALGLLPSGTGNVWAMELGLPIPSPVRRYPLLGAAKTMLAGQVRRVDVGRSGERHFLLWAGVGLDAEVTAHIEPKTRAQKRLGTLSYIIAALLVAKNFAGTRVVVNVDGQTVRARALLIVVSNTQLYGRIVRIASQARLDDGLLDVCIFKGFGFPATLRHALRVLAGQHLRDPRVVYHQGRRVSISSARPLAVQMDGDPVGHTPISLEIVPRALNIIVPAHTPDILFRDGPASPRR